MREESSTAVAPPARSGVAAHLRERAQPSWIRWVLPSFADIIFLALTGILAFTPASAALLRDADTGWHIRNGEFILATRSVPHTDLFSYTRAGQPWYAWEWLYDAAIAGIHHFSGLNGLVLFTAAIIALTFALLFRIVLRRSGNLAVAVGLALLAACTARIHMLARPHVLSWLFTLLWVDLLYRYEEGKRSALFWLPPLMLLWVNVHGGFILGLVLLGLFGCARIWKFATDPSSGAGRQIVELAIAWVVCLATTLLTPYGYKLHIHVYEYLSNGYLMNVIDEFLSPNFHATGFGYFEFLILLSFFAVAAAYRRVTTTDLLVLLFSVHAGLYAARNIPLSAILMSISTAPLWAGILSPDSSRRSTSRWLTALLEAIHDISGNTGQMEKWFRGHALALLALGASTAIVLNGGHLGSAQVVSARFSENSFPVRATEFIRSQHIHNHLFSIDGWSGYLIYRLYPETKLYVDDRHDFYGEDYIREFVRARQANWMWRQILDKYQIQWVLVPPDIPLAGVLKESSDWRVEFDDGMAIVFSRRGPPQQTNPEPARGPGG